MLTQLLAPSLQVRLRVAKLTCCMCVDAQFTDCDCALPNGAPSIGEAWVDVDPHDSKQVHAYFRAVQERNQRCYASPTWTIKSAPDGREFNFLDFIGTNVLAKDIEVLRRTIGSPKLNVAGLSYGTSVAAAYASIFKKSVGKVELNSNLPPDPGMIELARGAARALDEATPRLMRVCEDASVSASAGKACQGHGPLANMEGLVAQIRELGLHAQAGALLHSRYRLGLGMVHGYISTCMNDVDWRHCFDHLVALASPNDSVRIAKVEEILDDRCRIPHHASHWDAKAAVITWRLYGVCIGPSHVGIDQAFGDSFFTQTAIMGADYYGRFTTQGAMRKYESVLAETGSFATGAFLALFGALFAWPAAIDPVQIGSDVEALVLGNIYDTSTAIKWTYAMHRMFPHSALLISQGTGHGTLGGWRFVDFDQCREAINRYWSQGILPQDSLLCRRIYVAK
jgi:pimeloyl-ACP methyl ester carboxylesterase